VEPLLTSPAELRDAMRAFSVSRVLSTAVVTGVINALADADSMSSDQLAGLLGLSSVAIRRFTATLAAIGIVTIADMGISLTDLGRVLADRAPDSLGPMARMLHREGWLAWTGFPDWLRNDFQRTDVFSEFGHDLESYCVFDKQMLAGSARHAPAVVAAAGLAGNESILDVGGGSGGMAREFLVAHESVRVTIGDRSYAQEGCLAHLAGIPAERWAFTEVNFFDCVPPGFDIYFLSRVLHDWPDDKASLILRSCVAAMAPEATLLVFDRAPGRGGVVFRMADLNTGLLCGGRERTAEEMIALLEEVGLEVRGATPITEEHWLFDAHIRVHRS
jgi:O-methyltransferase domain